MLQGRFDNWYLTIGRRVAFNMASMVLVLKLNALEWSEVMFIGWSQQKPQLVACVMSAVH